jgi:hypothetical protein
MGEVVVGDGVVVVGEEAGYFSNYFAGKVDSAELAGLQNGFAAFHEIFDAVLQRGELGAH